MNLKVIITRCSSFAMLALLLTIYLSGSPDPAAAFSPQDKISNANLGPPPASNYPELKSVVITPGQLKKGNRNKIKVVIKFAAGNNSLKGGSFELDVIESNGYKRELAFTLDHSKFSRSKGKFKFKFFLVVGNAKKVKFYARLRDSGGMLSNFKNVTLKASGPKAKPWGAVVGRMAKDFTLYNHDGEKVSLHDYYGKVILLDFSTTW